MASMNQAAPKIIGTIEMFNDERGAVPSIKIGGQSVRFSSFSYSRSVDDIGRITLELPASQFEFIHTSQPAGFGLVYCSPIFEIGSESCMERVLLRV